MYLTPTDKHWITDIETDDLKATVIWVVCFRNAVTKQEHKLTDYEQIKDFIQTQLNDGCYFVGHNFLTFDGPTLNRLVGTRIPISRMVDTFLLSMLYSPSLRNGHSLDAWGERTGFPKGDFNDWSHLSEKMIEYCLNDVRLTAIVFDRLSKRMRDVGFTEASCKLEHLAWHNINKQRKNGFAFDKPRAHQLFATIRGIENELREEIYHQFPPQLLKVAEYKQCRKKDGSYSKRYEDHLKQFPKLVELPGGSYEAYDYVEFNLGSPQQRTEKLLELGWVNLPDEVTKTGNPQPVRKGVLAPSLEAFANEAGIPEVKLIADWMAFNGRGNMIGTWLDSYNEETGCIHGNLWLAGTLRYRHDQPNTANIPAVRLDKADNILYGRAGYFTYEARDCWVTRDPVNRNLVGVDAKGIQLRILAEYLKDDEFTEAILSKDPHTANQRRMGLPSRALTKTITYATLMGAGDKRIAAEAKVDLKEAKAAKKKFFEQVPGLKNLVAKLKNEVKQTGRITLCDGSRILVPSDHMVIPYLLQGDESRIMKQAGIYVDELNRKQGLDVLKVGDIHDEWQNDTSKEDTERFIQNCQQSFERTRDTFGYSVPLDCDAKVGLTWAETH